MMPSGSFLSTLSLRRATHYDNYNLHCVEISIHALLAESDHPITVFIRVIENFYPRSPCGERLKSPIKTHRQEHFYPRSPCGERRISSIINNVIDDFYPRSPCGERRFSYFYIIKITGFLSTLSLRRATTALPITPTYENISIHALLAESDANGADRLNCFDNFYPRSPCGERPAELTTLINKLFISIHALLAESDIMRIRVAK